jgi:GNAT superfamily N-acetyltransferase
MCDDWFSLIKLPLSIEQFHRLPRNAAYKYEYLKNEAWLTPRPKHYHALLELQPLPVPTEVDAQETVALRRLEAEDWEHLPSVFAGAFDRVQPFGSLDDETQEEAARKCLEHTRTGGDGPLIQQASFVAVSQEDGHRRGAILITLVPDRDLTNWDSCRWAEAPPPDCLERRLGRPHLTWIFVGPWHAGHGVGTALLAAAVRELLALGYKELASTFLLGNDSSMLWHWRNGFQLLPYPGSWRQMRERLRREETRASTVQNQEEASPHAPKTVAPQKPQSPSLSCDQALKIAREDAEKVYRDLLRYHIRLALEADGWHVDYDLKDPRARGCGPHYIIDAASGAIVSKRYEQ